MNGDQYVLFRPLEPTFKTDFMNIIRTALEEIRTLALFGLIIPPEL